MQMSYKFTNVLNEGTKIDGFNMKLYLSTRKPHLSIRIGLKNFTTKCFRKKKENKIIKGE